MHSKKMVVILTQATEWFDPSSRSTAFGATQFTPASNLHVVVRFNNIVDVLIWINLQYIIKVKPCKKSQFAMDFAVIPVGSESPIFRR